jgi:NADH-quinone oxidoreductase subunit N
MNYLVVLPPLLMVLFACATLLIDALSRDSQRASWLVWFNCLGQLAVAFSLVQQWRQLPVRGFSGSLTVDALALFASALVWLAVVALLLTSYRYLEIVGEPRGEYYALALFAQTGMYFMACASDMVTLFVGLELTSISFYILVGFTRADRRSNEAALKYLLLGALSTAFTLYGFSLLYGISGSTKLADVIPLMTHQDAFAVVATVAIGVGLLFKVSAAPFHFWAPDAYDGAPTPVAGYLSVASKIASFAVLIRFASGPTWAVLLTVVAVVSLTVGSIAAITQERLKRLFAYSAIAHAGYAILGIISGSIDAVAVYLLVYAFMTLGAFAVLTALRRKGIPGDQVSDLRGLSQSHPFHAALFAVLLLSLAGIPPTAGFIGKYFIFAALIRSGNITLAVIASAYVVVSLYFYFRLVREMYLEPAAQERALAASFGVRFALGGAVLLTLAIGLFPQPALNFLRAL